MEKPPLKSRIQHATDPQQWSMDTIAKLQKNVSNAMTAQSGQKRKGVGTQVIKNLLDLLLTSNPDTSGLMVGWETLVCTYTNSI